MKQLLDLLSTHDRRRLGALFLAVIVMALLELVGIASILPFMQLVSQPETTMAAGPANRLFGLLGLETYRSRVIGAGLAVLILITLANLASAGTMWFQHRTAWRTAHGLASRLVKTYAAQSYQFFLNRNSAELARQAIVEVNELVTGVLLSIGDLLARATVALVIIGLLLVVNASLALSAALVLGASYGFIYLLRRRRLTALGEERVAANMARFKAITELLGGIKSIKVYGTQPFFFRRFEEASRRVTAVHPRFQIIAQTPRYFIEMVAFGGILIATMYLVVSGRRLDTVLPVLSLFALAAYRLIPSLQLLFAAAARLRHTWPVVDDIAADLGLPIAEWPDATSVKPVRFDRSIRFSGVAFHFQGADRPILQDIDLEIPRGAHIALVGPTGSGKTTIVDILVGLLRPSSGSVHIDSRPLDVDNLAGWQSRLAYVPQEVFLYDETVARNVALGVSNKDIDRARLHEAARLAQAHGFIEAELAEGYDTPIGERGVRLSGGQRQRLGVARALYRNPDLLVFDEATSALDGTTERALMAALRSHRPDLTIVMIAHRLETVRECDRIYLIDSGKIEAFGTFDELLAVSEAFRDMAGPGSR